MQPESCVLKAAAGEEAGSGVATVGLQRPPSVRARPEAEAPELQLGGEFQNHPLHRSKLLSSLPSPL